MPHDRNGKELRKGDRVTMEFDVLDVSMSDDGCNVHLAAVAPGGEYAPHVACNSRVVFKVDSGSCMTGVKPEHPGIMSDPDVIPSAE
jgi:hypothetical protein